MRAYAHALSHLAAAQVHLAKLKHAQGKFDKGLKVAIKVQHPNLNERLALDMAILMGAADYVGSVAGVPRGRLFLFKCVGFALTADSNHFIDIHCRTWATMLETDKTTTFITLGLCPSYHRTRPTETTVSNGICLC